MFEFDGYKVLQRLIIIGGEGETLDMLRADHSTTDSNHNICLQSALNLTWILGSHNPLSLSKIYPLEWFGN